MSVEIFVEPDEIWVFEDEVSLEAHANGGKVEPVEVRAATDEEIRLARTQM